mmetsp:Transcript_16745/g.28396  ORF Transcript_16745/g.28396 Transcript_16745/m.28396 type:complete len:129 (+) Transcript_16745:66-452(+)
MAKNYDPTPPQPKINKFRVPIGMPERWKVESIAKYKQLQATKAAKLAKLTGSLITSNGKGKPVGSDGNFQANAVHRNNIPIDHIKKELEILHNNSIVIRNKMMALSSVRISLLWLLKKSTQMERELVG